MRIAMRTRRISLRKHWPNVPKIKNVKDANRTNLPEFDILAFGFPCTNLSLAGLREGLAGDASGLWFEAHRIAVECRPRVVLVENVPGLFSSANGSDFAIVLGGLLGCPVGIPADGWKTAGIAKGRLYHVAWRVLDSQFFGVAQRRRRVFLAGCLVGSGLNPAEILFEREGVSRDYQTRKEARKDSVGAFERSGAIGGTGGGMSSTLSSKYNGAEQVGRLVAGSQTSCQGGPDDNDACAGHLVAGPLQSSDGKRGTQTDTLPYVAQIAPTLNAQFGDKQGLENQHIDSGGGCSLPATNRESINQPKREKRYGN